jgi:RNA polymerase sigma factor (sigma-70 family)
MNVHLPPIPASAASLPDEKLLRMWVEHRDEDAFRTLAHRHLNLVIATACRCTGHTALAEEATQMVLTILSRKAAALERVTLGPWLHRTTVLECRALLRRESRHRRRVHALASEPLPEQCPAGDDAWQDALPVLDEMIDRLRDEDRRVLMLRFFEDMSFREIAGRIGKSEAAVQRQGHRALERLGSLLRRRGVALPAAALACGPGAVHAAVPASFVQNMITNVFAGVAPQPGAAALFINTLHTMSQTKVALATAAAVTLLAMVPIGFQSRENGRLARDLASAEARLAALAAADMSGTSGTSAAVAAANATDPAGQAGEKGRRITAGRAGKSESDKNSGEKKTNLFAGLGEYLENPQMKKMLEGQIAGQIESLYGPFIDSLALSPVERKHLVGIMSNWMTMATQDALKAMGSTSEDRKKLGEASKARSTAQRELIREFLNDDNDYNRYRAWEDRLQEHQAMSTVRQELEKRGQPLDQVKEQALVELMYNERKASPYTNDYSNPEQDYSVERPFTNETVESHVKEMEALQDRVASATAGLLTPAQIEGLRAANRTNAQLARTSLKMAVSLMGSVQNGPTDEVR